MTDAAGAAVSLTQVRKRYRIRGPWVLDGVDLTVCQGDLVRISGSNGSGKSTLLRMAAGVGRPTSGQVSGDPTIGFVPEQFSATLPFTVLEYLVHRGRMEGLNAAVARPRGGELLESFGAAEFARTSMRELSQGTLQKVAVVQALLPSPQVFVLDEAWTGLDAVACHALDVHVDQRLADGAAVVYVDHDRARLAGRPMLEYRLDGGRLTPGRTVSDAAVPADSGTCFEMELEGLPDLAPDALATLLALPAGTQARPEGPGRIALRVPVGSSDEVLRRALAAGPDVHVHRVMPR